MNEIVIDANVFAHADNPCDKYFESAVILVNGLLSSALRLAIDDTGKNAPDPSTSHMYCEYRRCLAPTSPSFTVFNQMLLSGRVVFHPRLKGAKREACAKLTPANDHDAIVLGVGTLTDLRLIVSNDYSDFHPRMRRQAKKQIDVDLVDSEHYVQAQTGTCQG
ncbi:Uncharacterised protein [Mycobacteroides abscessus subsp. abscessus]|uniref:hypothetical protein n=1 Tax=Mycobacteroides abscessus TaxID=36809 RepID=UPI000929D734|nr:hypothetical protein [Mycobacteroides abscessus]SIK10437.1 Uncharacterised protein [Mycobacteroides abscessus subsp. abscessus]